MLRRATVHLVDGSAHITNQAFEFETVHRDYFDVMTRLAGLQGMLNLFEWNPYRISRVRSSGVS